MSKTVWLTGLSGAGKTTIASGVKEMGLKAVLLDGDELRTGLCKDLMFSIEDRRENIRRVAEVAKLFNRNNQLCICSFISPTKEIREMAESIIGADNFIEVFVSTPFEICAERDPKGLYERAIAGEIKNFTGVDSVYEKPDNPAIILNCHTNSIQKSTQVLYDFLNKKLS